MKYSYDYVGRVSSVARGTAGANANGNINNFTATTTLGTTYTFVASGYNQYDANATTPLVAGITHGCGMTFGYTYDNVGNITQETRDNVQTTYVYDSLGQLTRVNDPNDKTSGTTGTTWVYVYDCGGNILQKKRYAYTTGALGTLKQTIPYTYGASAWKDKLTSYNGKAITYDAIGNPLTYDGWSYTWQAGRQLEGMENEDDHKSVSFTYNHDGLRTRKIVSVGSTNPTVTTTEYLLHGKLVTGVKQGNTELHFFSNRSRRNLRFSVRRMLRMLCFASQNRLHTVFYAVLRTAIKTACGTF